MKGYQGLDLEIIKEQIAKFCSFSLGEEHILKLEPEFNSLVLTRENLRIKEALEMTITYGSMPFFGVNDISNTLQATKKGRCLSALECVEILQVLKATVAIHNYYSNMDKTYESVEELIDSLIVHKSVKEKLEICFNEDGMVLDTASTELNTIRRQIKRVENEILQITTSFLQKNKESLVESLIISRSDRNVVLVKLSDKNKFGGFIYGESASGQAVYVEPAAFIAINNEKQSLLTKEKEEIERILQGVSYEIQIIADELLNNIETLGILDALFAKAQWGKSEDACVAQLTKEKKIIINKSRHPLISKKDAIFNTYTIQNPFSTLLITGTNTGGKTVSLKCVGLSVLMTYCGMPICCDEALIPIFDQVFIDIGDDQSVVQSLSTFSAHLSKLAIILKEATKDSLVLLDELGSGTDPKEGESLAIAILDELRCRKTTVIATTHYGKLKVYGNKHDDILIASVQFDMESLKPTYRYIEGSIGQSNAFDIAKRFEIQESVIEHARKLKEEEKPDEERLIEKLESQLVENEKLKQEMNEKIKLTQEKMMELDQLRKNIEIEKEKIISRSKEESSEIIMNAKTQSENILKELKEVSKTIKYHEALKVKEKLNALEMDEQHIDSEHVYQVGDFVELIQSSQLAQISTIEKSRVTLDLNGKTIHAKLAQIKPSNRKKEKAKSLFSVKTNKIHEFNPECNVIGLRVDEALEMVSKHLDDALFFHYPQVCLVHGDGSGTLRKAIHEWLKKNKNVDSFRLGSPKEGSTGATVVVLKEKNG